MIAGGRVGIGGGGVFLAAFLLPLTPSVTGRCMPGSVFDRCLASASTDDLLRSAMSSSALTLLYRLLDAVGTLDCRVSSSKQNTNAIYYNITCSYNNGYKRDGV